MFSSRGKTMALLRHTKPLIRAMLRAQRHTAARPQSAVIVEPRKLVTSYQCEPSEMPMTGETYGQHIDTAAAKWGDDVGWVFQHDNQQITFASYKADVDCVCKGLLAAGFTKGDTIAIWSPNSYNWVVLYGAMAKIGILSACVHPAYTAAEFEKVLTKVRFAGIYIPESFKVLKYYEMLCSLIPELKESSPGQLNSKKYPFLKGIIVESDKALPGCINWQDILQGGNVNLAEAENKVGMDDPITIVFTSGTTGTPKAAMLSHHGFVNNSIMYDHGSPDPERSILCSPLPFFHVFGMTITCGLTVIRGNCAVVPCAGYDTKEVLKSIHNYRCSQVAGAPTMITDMINHPDFKSFDLSSLNRVVMGGNVVTPEMRKLAREKFKAHVWVGYGATETTTASTLVTERDPESKQATTVGRPVGYVEVKVADPATGKETAINEPGEVWIRGHNVFIGYYNDEEKTKEVKGPAGWYKTGDLGKMDEDGYLSIIGRLKDMVIRGGENIYPLEIEEVLNTHPAIQECHVIGVPDSRMGEELCAWVLLNPESKVTDSELQQYCKGKLSHFKIPKYFLYETDYPKTAIGKAQKNKMRETAAKKLGL
ncbi:hypothetical protein MTO96_001012 [Rhipicephalus appendiculatus]|uniref:Medium-chain acyl-CoA ligase ACSF2, mitochondrial n=1 Tax=Rhipicephalus appendiculatus TaxID=34631 RepID=A0A131YJM2_RHIAP